LRLPRDHYVRPDSNEYSVHPGAVGRLVEVRADLSTVTVTLARSWGCPPPALLGKDQSLTDPEHQKAAALLRRQQHQRHWAAPAGHEVERRALSDYYDAFGTAGQVAW
jgi:hypothetical protein